VGGHSIRVRGRIHPACRAGPRQARARGGIGPHHLDRRGDVRRPRTSHRGSFGGNRFRRRRPARDRIPRCRGDSGGVHSLVLMCAHARYWARRTADRRRADSRCGDRRASHRRAPRTRGVGGCGVDRRRTSRRPVPRMPRPSRRSFRDTHR
jgi:hypothetical protein